MKRGKKYLKTSKNLDRNKSYTLEDGIKEVKRTSYSKFIGSLEAHFDIIIPKDRDPKSIKGALSLPYSSDSKDVTILAFVTPDKEKDAKDAGANYVGLESLIKDIKDNKITFDVAIATPSVMPKIAILGKELGPKGLMPSPKNGTVTDDIKSAIEEYKKGKQTFACDTSGVIHIKAGKLDMDDDKLISNLHTAVSAIEEVMGKAYNQAVTKMHITSTMGPSFKIDYKKVE